MISRKIEVIFSSLLPEKFKIEYARQEYMTITEQEFIHYTDLIKSTLYIKIKESPAIRKLINSEKGGYILSEIIYEVFYLHHHLKSERFFPITNILHFYDLYIRHIMKLANYLDPDRKTMDPQDIKESYSKYFDPDPHFRHRMINLTTTHKLYIGNFFDIDEGAETSGNIERQKASFKLDSLHNLLMECARALEYAKEDHIGDFLHSRAKIFQASNRIEKYFSIKIYQCCNKKRRELNISLKYSEMYNISEEFTIIACAAFNYKYSDGFDAEKVKKFVKEYHSANTTSWDKP